MQGTSDRQPGRTSAQVMTLAQGDVFIVHSNEMRIYARVLIADLRTATFLLSINVLMVRDIYDLDRLAGWRGRIVVDHAASAHFERSDARLWAALGERVRLSEIRATGRRADA